MASQIGGPENGPQPDSRADCGETVDQQDGFIHSDCHSHIIKERIDLAFLGIAFYAKIGKVPDEDQKIDRDDRP